jgi:hypothetical protein
LCFNVSPETESLNAGDPTDDALATIASILENPIPHPEPPRPGVSSAVPEQLQVDGYSKTGPGPIPALRFKWTVRRGEHHAYYVDETVGGNLTPVVSGPMSADAAVALVNERENYARGRFEQIKGEMVGPTAAPHPRDDGEGSD